MLLLNGRSHTTSREWSVCQVVTLTWRLKLKHLRDHGLLLRNSSSCNALTNNSSTPV